MSKAKTISSVLKDLREKDGIEEGKLSSLVGDNCVVYMLINSTWKLVNDIELSAVEQLVREESGDLILDYVFESYIDDINNKYKEVPFPEVDLTAEELIRFFEEMKKREEETAKILNKLIR